MNTLPHAQEPKTIVALDFDSIHPTRNLVAQLNPKLCRLKVGPVLFTRYGPALIEELIKQQFSVFLDLKFHDIPQTVAEACRAATELGVWMMTLHIAGGPAMIEMSLQAIDKVNSSKKPLLVGITALTSLDENDLRAIGITESVEEYVMRLAKLGIQCGLQGVVSSAKETPFLKKALGNTAIFVTPGIRLKSDEASDQKRILTPKDAVLNGADYLVIGRSITQAQNPLLKLQEINQEIKEVFCPERA
jgi:orotidine-5'-phosphate decarboxylase